MPSPTTYQKKLATTAGKEFEKFRLFRENQDPLMSRIEEYWTELGLTFESVAVAWSAVFVSWCVKEAGATSQQFKFSSLHSQFVKRAIANAKTGTGLFHGRRLSEYAPKMGDILHNNRSGNH